MKKILPKKARLDKLAGFLVRERGRCQNDIDCHSVGSLSEQARRLTWAHIVSRRYLNTRWELDNAFCLCMGCHLYFTYHPIEWEVFVTTKIGAEKYEELKQKALEVRKLDYSLIGYKLAKMRDEYLFGKIKL